MSEGLQAGLAVAAITLFAVLVGALLPLLFEARTVLKETRRFLGGTGRRLEDVLTETTGVMGKMNRIAIDLEHGTHAVAEALDQAQGALRVLSAIGASVGPAVAAAVRAVHSARENGQDEARRDGANDLPTSAGA